VNYDILPQAVTNKSRYGNTYIFTLSNHKIECRDGKPVALDVSLGNVSVQVNMQFVDEAHVGGSAAGFSYLPRGYYQLKEGIALPQANAEIVRSRSTPSPGLLAYYQRLLGDATDDVAFVKQAEVPGLTESGYVFTTLEDRANRIYVTVNPDYYDRKLSKSAPQHILIRIRRLDTASLNATGNGARHLESFQKLREIVRANLPELRAMVK